MVLILQMQYISDLRSFLFEVDPSNLHGGGDAEPKARYRIDTDKAWSQRPDSIIHKIDPQHGPNGDNEIGRVEWSMMHYRKAISCNGNSIDMTGHIFSKCVHQYAFRFEMTKRVVLDDFVTEITHFGSFL
jgi:hypothetical protein